MVGPYRRGPTVTLPGRPDIQGRVTEPDRAAGPDSVRPARTSDVDDVAAVQVRAWRQAYAEVLPQDVLADLDAGEIAWEWGRGLLRPQGHLLLVAVEGASGNVVGAAAIGPGVDPDLDPATVGEITLLVVDPDHQRRGHGSRLMAAAVDHLRGAGRTEAIAWLPLADEPRRAFWLSTGWGPDSAYRDLEMLPGATLREVRLVTVL
jgi:ribosomal protein S18 acetylase RimI-like enzyme